MEERMRELEERLARMERRHGWWRNLSLVLVVAAVAAGVWSCTRFGVQPVVAAERFELKNSEGQLRGIWETSPDEGTKLEVIDDGGESQVHISVDPSGASNIHLLSGKQQLRLAASRSEIAAASMVMKTIGTENSGSPGINIMLDHQGDVGLAAANKDGLVQIGITRSGEASSWIRSNGGAAEVTVDSDGNPRFVMSRDFSKETIFSVPSN